MKANKFLFLVLLILMSSPNVAHAQFWQGFLYGVGQAAQNYNNQRQNSNRRSSDYYANKYGNGSSNSRTTEPEVTKTRKVEDDGFVWYRLRRSGGTYGIENANGDVVLYPDYGSINYDKESKNFDVKCESGCHEGVLSKSGSWIIPLDREYESLYYSDLFDKYVVEKNGFKGICSTDGKEIIAPSKYSSIHLYEGIYYVEKDGYEGACDANGKEIIAPNSYKDILFLSGEFKYKNDDGDWISMNIDKYGNKIQQSYISSANSENINRKFYDALIYDLKGHVKSFTTYTKLDYEDDFRKDGPVEFSETGKIVSTSTGASYERNANNMIIGESSKIDYWGEPAIYYKKIEYKNNKLSSIQSYFVCQGENKKRADSKDTFYYNTKGFVAKVIDKSLDGSGRVDFITEYQYVSIDEKGNWTERKYEDPMTLNEVTEKRVIEYY